MYKAQPLDYGDPIKIITYPLRQKILAFQYLMKIILVKLNLRHR